MSDSPWISIWFRPRETIARIVSHNPNRSLWLLAAIYGFSALLSAFQTLSLGLSVSAITLLGAALVFGVVWGYVAFAIWSWVILWVGKLFRGRADFVSVRAAYTWSCVPMIFNIPLWLILVYFFGQLIFINTPEGYSLPGHTTELFAILICKLVLAIWSLVIYLNTLAEVEGFSMLRSIFTVLIGFIIATVALAGFWVGVAYLLDLSTHSVQGAAMLFGQSVFFIQGSS